MPSKTKHRGLIAGLAGLAAALAAPAGAAFAGPDPYIGEVQLSVGSYCPREWTETNGQLLSIAQNTALFSLIGTRFGGDGRNTFALPDLRGRAAVSWGSPPGIPSTGMGQRSGEEITEMTVAQMPSHSHSLNASNRNGTLNTPANNDIAEFDTRLRYASTAPDDVTMADAVIGTTGSGQAFSIIQPSQVMRYCIALYGIYPSRP
ncbi:MAG: tail fiber protein [Oceanicaulis sp.]